MELGNYCKATQTPFDNSVITMNLDKIMLRITKKNLASVIIIDGGLGLGKTTLAVQLGSYWQGSPINFNDQIALGGGQLMEKLLICHEKKLKVLIYDEASDFNRRGALTKFNADLNRVFDVCRAFKIIIIIVLPSVKVLDNDLFHKGIVRCLFHVADKGLTYNLNWAYSADRVAYLMRALKDSKKNPLPSKCYTKVFPNFTFRTYNLTNARADELEKCSTASKLDVLEQNVVRLNGLVNTGQIAKLVAMSKPWVVKCIRDNGMLPQTINKRIKYFNAEQVELVRSKIKNNVAGRLLANKF